VFFFNPSRLEGLERRGGGIRREITSVTGVAWIQIVFGKEMIIGNLHVCTVHQRQLKHFIIQQMHKYIIRRYY